MYFNRLHAESSIRRTPQGALAQRLARWFVAGACGIALPAAILACGGAKKTAFEVVIKTDSDPGKPLAGVRIVVAGADLGTTGPDGRAKLALGGMPGDTVEVRLSCPEGFAAIPDEPISIVLRQIVDAKVPEYRATCSPKIRSLVIAVRAEHGAFVPVEYLGRAVARTDAAGVAHAALQVAPGDQVRISLNTNAPEHANLRPQNPELKVVMPARDELVLFEQSFTIEEPPPPPPKPKRRVFKRVLPTRLGSHR